METILTIVAVGTLNVVCFFVGSKIGQMVAKDKDIEMPKVNPLEYVQAQREKKHAREEQERYNIILENVNNYNGTDAGQKDVPR